MSHTLPSTPSPTGTTTDPYAYSVSGGTISNASLQSKHYGLHIEEGMSMSLRPDTEGTRMTPTNNAQQQQQMQAASSGPPVIHILHSSIVPHVPIGSPVSRFSHHHSPAPVALSLGIPSPKSLNKKTFTASPFPLQLLSPTKLSAIQEKRRTALLQSNQVLSPAHSTHEAADQYQSASSSSGSAYEISSASSSSIFVPSTPDGSPTADDLISPEEMPAPSTILATLTNTPLHGRTPFFPLTAAAPSPSPSPVDRTLNNGTFLPSNTPVSGSTSGTVQLPQSSAFSFQRSIGSSDGQSSSMQVELETIPSNSNELFTPPLPSHRLSLAAVTALSRNSKSSRSHDSNPNNDVDVEDEDADEDDEEEEAEPSRTNLTVEDEEDDDMNEEQRKQHIQIGLQDSANAANRTSLKGILCIPTRGNRNRSSPLRASLLRRSISVDSRATTGQRRETDGDESHKTNESIPTAVKHSTAPLPSLPPLPSWCGLPVVYYASLNASNNSHANQSTASSLPVSFSSIGSSLSSSSTSAASSSSSSSSSSTTSAIFGSASTKRLKTTPLSSPSSSHAPNMVADRSPSVFSFQSPVTPAAGSSMFQSNLLPPALHFSAAPAPTSTSTVSPSNLSILQHSHLSPSHTNSSGGTSSSTSVSTSVSVPSFYWELQCLPPDSSPTSLPACPPLHAWLKSCYVIGRHSSADHVIDHMSLSRLHARIMIHERTGQLFLQDLNSTHGTFVDGQRITSMREAAATGRGQLPTADGSIDSFPLASDPSPSTCGSFPLTKGCTIRFGASPRTYRVWLYEERPLDIPNSFLFDTAAAAAAVSRSLLPAASSLPMPFLRKSVSDGSIPPSPLYRSTTADPIDPIAVSGMSDRTGSSSSLSFSSDLVLSGPQPVRRLASSLSNSNLRGSVHLDNSATSTLAHRKRKSVSFAVDVKFHDGSKPASVNADMTDESAGVTPKSAPITETNADETEHDPPKRQGMSAEEICRFSRASVASVPILRLPNFPFNTRAFSAPQASAGNLTVPLVHGHVGVTSTSITGSPATVNINHLSTSPPTPQATNVEVVMHQYRPSLPAAAEHDVNNESLHAAIPERNVTTFSAEYQGIHMSSNVSLTDASSASPSLTAVTASASSSSPSYNSSTSAAGVIVGVSSPASRSHLKRTFDASMSAPVVAASSHIHQLSLVTHNHNRHQQQPQHQNAMGSATVEPCSINCRDASLSASSSDATNVESSNNNAMRD